MSKRRRPGDIVSKIPNAGFSQRSGLCLIPPNSKPIPCFLCNDENCQEWPDLWELDENLKPTGKNWCHVSECEMVDKEDNNEKI